MANPETLNNSNEDLIQESLQELKDQIKPGIVNFENESRDKKYNIYSYTLVQGGTRGGIKNKYINQIGPWVEGTQFTDINGNEIKKDKFDAGEKVYLRVPKKSDTKKESNNQKETKNIPGKVEYIGNKKDKENRNWKFYSYTFTQGGNIGGAMNKFESQLGMSTNYYRFCDKDGKKLTKEYFNKGETIYYKTPNTDIIDSTPEMTTDEIMKLSKDDLYKIFINNEKYINHSDKNGNYTIINNRKLYYINGQLTNNRTYLDIYLGEGEHYIMIGKKVGNKIIGVYMREENHYFEDSKVYKGNLTYKNGEFQPEK